MKRKLGIIAVAVLSTMTFSQVVNASEVVNPEDSGYLGPVIQDNRSQVAAPGIDTGDAFWYRSTGGVAL